MKMKFIGLNGSMGFVTGKIYDVKVGMVDDKIVVTDNKSIHRFSQYDSLAAFLHNWGEPTKNTSTRRILGCIFRTTDGVCKSHSDTCKSIPDDKCPYNMVATIFNDALKILNERIDGVLTTHKDIDEDVLNKLRDEIKSVIDKKIM